VVLPDQQERDRLLERLMGRGRPVRDTDSGPAVSDPSGNVLVLAG
jgi:hypothetical protein